jgi:hypothetical protein
MRAGVVIAPKIPSSSGSQFSPMLAPRLAVGLFTGQAGCPADGRLRRSARQDTAGPSSASCCPAAAAATRCGSPERDSCWHDGTAYDPAKHNALQRILARQHAAQAAGPAPQEDQ